MYSCTPMKFSYIDLFLWILFLYGLVQSKRAELGSFCAIHFIVCINLMEDWNSAFSDFWAWWLEGLESKVMLTPSIASVNQGYPWFLSLPINEVAKVYTKHWSADMRLYFGEMNGIGKKFNKSWNLCVFFQ